MAVPIRMPMPGQMTEECTVLQWYKAEGDTVSKGDPLFEIETDKSNMEIEAFDEGTLLRIDAPEGATVPVEAIVAWGPAVPDALKAAEQLAGEGIECEVIDLRTLVPLDMEPVLASVAKTGRCVVAAQAVLSGSYVNEVVARVVAEAFDDLDAPVARIGAANGISPQAEGLEAAFLPNVGDIANAVKGLI